LESSPGAESTEIVRRNAPYTILKSCHEDPGLHSRDLEIAFFAMKEEM